MIIFDKCKYVTDIMRHGINENDSRANSKLFLVAKYLIEETTYKPCVIKRNLKKYSEKYFNGLSEDVIDKEIENIYNKAKNSHVIEEEKNGMDNEDEDSDVDIDWVDAVNYFAPKHINLYEEEMRKISELEDKVQELAFAFLVVNKYQGYKWTYECNSEIYKICHWDKKGNGKNQSTKDSLIHKLVDNGIIRFYCNTNSAYRYNKSWIAKTSFTVLINEDNFAEKEHSKLWKTITNYDDVLLYWRLYKGDPTVGLCEKCGTPIEKTSNSKKYCSNCALNNIRESKKRNKESVSKMSS